jgi:hypothetical protein
LGRAAAHTAIPVWAGIMTALLLDAPALPFASDAELQYATVDPWSGLLADSTCTKMDMPFIPGTAPTGYCMHGEDWGYENLDSLYAVDSLHYEYEEPDSAYWTPPDEDVSDPERDDADDPAPNDSTP